MNVAIGAEAAQFREKEYINGIAVAVQEWKRKLQLKIVSQFCMLKMEQILVHF
jgi:hypothetical protein